jgi:mycothiol system anti-sigma-R factor
VSCGNPHATPCSQVLDQVYSYLDGEMTEHDRSHIRQHLIECAPCLKEYDLDEALKALVRRSCSGESAPEELRLKIMTRITQVRIEYDV